MKKFVTTLLICCILASCQKEVSYERTCGTVTQKLIRNDGFYIDVLNNGSTTRYNIGLIPYSKINEGDTYCP